MVEDAGWPFLLVCFYDPILYPSEQEQSEGGDIVPER
jgi:hypothetical protein